MTTLLLIIIYIAFISLGLPDSLLGTAWPVMQSKLGQSLDTAGYIYFFIASGTILSSLLSGKVNAWLGTGKVIAISVFLTATALFGFAHAPSLIWLVLFSIPLGLGGGAVDAALNNYVALYYKASHMSWLHACWGLGASTGPVIMAYYIHHNNAWDKGYLTVSTLQFALTFILLISIPLWMKVAKKGSLPEHDEGIQVSEHSSSKPVNSLKISGVKLALLTFFFYCGAEATMGLWGSSYLVHVKAMDPEIAAKWVAFFFAGITMGRLLSGFLAMKVTSVLLIRYGQWIAISGAILLILPLPNIVSLFGFIIIGLGMAPIFPSMIHETPTRFGRLHSQTIIGYQMAAAYVGVTLIPPLFGFFANAISMQLFSFFIVLFAVSMLFTAEKLTRVLKARQQS